MRSGPTILPGLKRVELNGTKPDKGVIPTPERPPDFTTPWPPFPFGSSRTKKARNSPQQFKNHVLRHVTPKRSLNGPFAVTFKFLLPINQRLCDLDGLVEPFLNALKGRCFRDDINVVELHAYRERVNENPRIELWLEDRPTYEVAEKLRKSGVTRERAEEFLREQGKSLPSVTSKERER